MTDDIVERLRQYTPLTCSACDTWGKCGYGEPCDCACHTHPCREAAAEIERLRAVERYAEHRDNCEQPYTAKRGVCSCGLSDLLEARRG